MIRTAIIAIAKNETQYIDEWLNHHFMLGFNTIIIGENDDTLILKDKIKDNRVIIEDYTKQIGFQNRAYKEMFLKYREQFDWVLFIDIDEFLILENNKTVSDFLSTFNDAQQIKLCRKHFTDNDELDVIDDNYNVLERFKTPISVEDDRKCKCFLKADIDEDYLKGFTQHSTFNINLKTVNALGEKEDYGSCLRTVIHQVAWVNHYRTKTIGEYIRQKYFRGGANLNNLKYSSLLYFWYTNTKTPEKEEYANKKIKELAKQG